MEPVPNAEADLAALIGTHDLLFVTFDTLRYDVAVAEWAAGRTPNFARWFPSGWERRHTPSSFTYGAHLAFFAGFLPTPATPGPHPRLFASRFEGSETTGPGTFVFDEPDLPAALARRDYHTLCLGGVGFFNKRNALGSVLPALSAESHWSPEMGVTARHSTENQVACALDAIARLPDDRRLFLFLNLSALHQPNCCYLDPPEDRDCLASHAAALRYADAALAPLMAALLGRAPLFAIFCSDHGTAYGEDGYHGHRIGHRSVWEVPYAQGVPRREDR